MTELTAREEALSGESPVRGLGARLRTLRKIHNKGVREAAGELGISASALSMIENDKGGVSIARLKMIADYFGVGVVDLLADSQGQSGETERLEIVRQSFSVIEGFVRGKGVWYQALPGIQGGLQVSLVTFQPGGGYASDSFSHRGSEVIYVLQGSVKLIYGERTETLVQGDLAFFSSETDHAFENASTHGPAALLGVSSDAW